jgi:hypothetical protein
VGVSTRRSRPPVNDGRERGHYRMVGDDMKRISIVGSLMLVLAACGSTSGSDTSNSGTSSSGV